MLKKTSVEWLEATRKQPEGRLASWMVVFAPIPSTSDCAAAKHSVFEVTINSLPHVELVAVLKPVMTRLVRVVHGHSIRPE